LCKCGIESSYGREHGGPSAAGIHEICKALGELCRTGYLAGSDNSTQKWSGFEWFRNGIAQACADVELMISDDFSSHPVAMKKASIKNHKSITHSKGVYAIGDVHTNNRPRPSLFSSAESWERGIRFPRNISQPTSKRWSFVSIAGSVPIVSRRFASYGNRPSSTFEKLTP